MSQRERGVLQVMSLVLQGERTQVEAARLLGMSSRQVCRLQRRLARGGDETLVGMIDDATDRVCARFHMEDTVRVQAVYLNRAPV